MQTLISESRSPFSVAAALAVTTLLTLLIVAGLRHRKLSGQLERERACTGMLRHAAYHDSLTGLRNRYALGEDAAAVLEGRDLSRENSAGKRAAVLLFDLDRFKLINDTMGHAAGDEVLKVLAARIANVCGPDRKVYRLGGDEFVVLWENAPAEAEMSRFCGLLASSVFRPVEFADSALETSGSIGIALAGTGEACTLSDMLKQADLALYRAKESPGVRHVFFSADMDNDYRLKRDLEAEMRAGLNNGAFGIEYLPVHEVDSPGPIGFSARLTWTHPVRGTVAPEAFLPIAEESGLIVMIGKWMLGEVLLAAQSWGRNEEVIVPVSISQLCEPGFSGHVAKMLADTGIAPCRLVCDLRTSAVPEGNLAAIAAIARLRTAGVRIAISEFSAGLAGLAMTRAHKVDRVRLHLGQIRAIAGDERLPEMLVLFLQLAALVETPVTVTGVDTQHDLECARAAGARQIEGRLVGPALGAAQTAEICSISERARVAGARLAS